MSRSAAIDLIRRFRVRELSKVLVPNGEPSTSKVQLQNPFIPFLNPESKRWAPPLYSLRRQAELIKAAKEIGALHLLPPGPKLDTREHVQPAVAPDLKLPKILQKDIEWMGELKVKKVPGADIGARLYAGKKRMFKTHKWERQYEKRQNIIRARMRDMPARIQRFKTHYERRRPRILSKPKAGKSAKLPF